MIHGTTPNCCTRRVMNKRVKKRVARFLILGVVTFFVFQFTSGCFSFRMSQKEMAKYFADKPVKPITHDLQVDDRTIRYVSAGEDSKPTVIFFHGAPGSWSAFVDFLADTSLLDQACLVSIDRPGYGHSDFGKSEYSLKRQAELMAPVLKKHKSTPNILVGHSLGGPVIARMAMDYPALVDALIMVAPSIDPGLEPNEDWFRAPLYTPLLRWILPTSFRVTNDEIYFLEDELIEMMPLWENIKAPVTVIQGTEDKLVPAGNADFAKEQLVNSPEVKIVLEEGMNHFVPWQRHGLIKTAITYYISKPWWDWSTTELGKPQ